MTDLENRIERSQKALKALADPVSAGTALADLGRLRAAVQEHVEAQTPEQHRETHAILQQLVAQHHCADNFLIHVQASAISLAVEYVRGRMSEAAYSKPDGEQLLALFGVVVRELLSEIKEPADGSR